MPKLTVFQITIDRPNGVYQAGDTLQGHVTVELAEEMKMRGIYLRLYGGANVHWSERHSSGSGKNRRTTTRHYRASECYFDYKLVLYGKAPGQDEDNPVHPPGRYTYPFHYQLPPNLPSSFEGAWGQVRYWLNCNIDKPWKFDHNCKKAYTVLSILDLNTQPNIMQPKDGQNSKTLCCLCCESGPISATFHIDRHGYVPGEFIVLSGEIDNKSNRTMTMSRVELRMYTTFHATSKSRTSTSVVSVIRKGAIEPGDTEVWSGEKFHIPALPPSALIHCRIIDISYHIVMIVDPSGPAFDLEVPLEVCLGTIPLQNIHATFANTFPPPVPMAPQNMYGGDAITEAPVLAMPSAPAMPSSAESQPNAPPPSYAECVTGKVNIREENDNEHTFGDLNFAPVYTYYSWDQNQGQGQPAQGQGQGQGQGATQAWGPQ